MCLYILDVWRGRLFFLSHYSHWLQPVTWHTLLGGVQTSKADLTCLTAGPSHINTYVLSVLIFSRKTPINLVKKGNGLCKHCPKVGIPGLVGLESPKFCLLNVEKCAQVYTSNTVLFKCPYKESNFSGPPPAIIAFWTKTVAERC